MNVIEKEYIRTDKNGTKYYEALIECPRCNGVKKFEVYKDIENGVCFQCDGAGTIKKNLKEYTPEHEAKLEKQREKRQAKKEEKLRKAEEKRQARIREREAKRKEQAEKSDFIGSEGEMLEKEVTCVFNTHFEVPSFSGYGTDLISIYKMIDEDYNVIIFKTQGQFHAEKGDKFTIKGRIKEHSIYDDEKQTVIQRAKKIN